MKFSAAADKKSAEEPSNYTLGSYSGSKTPVLVDDKTVVLTLDPEQAKLLQQESKTLTVANIVSGKDSTKKFQTFSGQVNFLDLTIPQALSAKLIGPGKVEVTFNEPVHTKTQTGFLIDGGQYSVTVANETPDNFATKTIILNTGNLSAGTHTITVNPDGDKKVEDGAGLYVAKTDIQFTVTEDKVAPVLVSGTASDQSSVVLTFDEQISGIAAGKVYHTAPGVSAYTHDTAATPVPGSGGKQWTIKFNGPLPTGNLTLYVAKEAVQDNFNNKNSQVLSTTVSVVSDTVKPTVSELKVVSANSLTLAFSEDVNGASTKANYKVTDSNGQPVAFTVGPFDSTTKKVAINFSPGLKEGATYNIEVTGITDKAVIPNLMDKYTSSFTVTDKSQPEVTEKGIYDNTNRKITVFFSEPMNGLELIDKSKYTLQVGSTIQVQLPSDAIVVAGPNNSSVSITLPSVVNDNAGNNIVDKITHVIVGQLSDLAGNKTKKVFTTVEVSPNVGEIDNGTVVPNSAITVDTRTVKFSIKKPLKTIIAADFTVNGKDVEHAQYQNKTLADGSYGAEIILTIPADQVWTTSTRPEIKTKNPDNALKSESLYGDKFKKNELLATSADGVAPVLADTNSDGKVDGKDLKFDLNADNKVEKITVTFSEELKSGTVSIDDFQVDGHSIGNVTLDKGNAVVIQLSKVGNNDELYTVRFVGAVSDTNGNVFEGKGVALENASVVVPPADKTTLNTAITEAGKLVETDYSTGWAEFQAALNAAKTVQSNKDATKAEVEKAVADLGTATKALVKKPVTVDKTALDTAITEAGKLVEADYSTGWAEFQTALNAAKTVQSNKDATKAEVEKAVADLGTATKALVKKPVTVDKTALDTAITEAGKLVEADYSTGWAEFQTALNAAKTVQSNKDATKAEVEKAVADLGTATKALVKKPVTVDKTALDTAITEAGKLVEADYSTGWAEFQTALNAAKTVQSNKDATKA
ncbi:Ig-like domain-containing protein, partial [Brevibacillus borstelensis]|uniref:Ig-like domain-containing protein n=1 Tax=Brevibacillus borstelensis TaxID=45462 RepID=UPI002041A981